MKIRYLIFGVIFLGVLFIIYKYGQLELRKEYYVGGELKTYLPVKKDKVHGKVIEYYEDGTIKSRVNFHEGKQDGTAEFFHLNGRLRREVKFISGVQQDTMKVFYDNGNLMELSYLSNGKKNGVFENYFENGVLKSKGVARNNNRNGEWTFYNTKGSVEKNSFYKDGILISELIRNNKIYTYTNKRFKYTFSISSSFSKAKESPDYVLFTLNKEGFKPSINVLTRKLNGVSFEDFINNELNSIMGITSEFKLLSRNRNGKNIIANYRALYDNFTVRVSTTFIRGADDDISIITYMSDIDSYDNNLKNAKMVEKTFRIAD